MKNYGRAQGLASKARMPRTSTKPVNKLKQRFGLEPLEPRLLLSTDPLPIDPDVGELNLLELIEAIPINEIEEALDNFPVPYVVIAQKEGLSPVVLNNRAGSPTRVDVDNSLSTGRGGHDIIVEVNTELLPTPHLTISLERIGTQNFVNDFTILVAFPFDAFTAEALPGAPNIFFGYQTTGATSTTPGGIAPFLEEMSFTIDVLGGTEHLFQWELETTGDVNPLRFFAGHFDGDVSTGLVTYDALGVWMENTPNEVTIGLGVEEDALFT